MNPSENTEILKQIAHATVDEMCAGRTTPEEMHSAWVDYHASLVADTIDAEILEELRNLK